MGSRLGRAVPAVGALLALACGSVAPVPAGSAGIPTKNEATQAPVVITQTSLFVDGATTFACVSFRNRGPKSVAFVNFTFRFNDQRGDPIREAVLPRSGSFSPNVTIEGGADPQAGKGARDNCVGFDTIDGAPTLEIVDVTQVRFDDGSAWNKERESFGAIAWVPGKPNMIGEAVDETSQDAATYEALYDCKRLGGGAACEIAVRMFDQFPCGAVAMDEAGRKFGYGRGPNPDAAITGAREALATAGGALTASSIVSAACDSP